MHMTKINVSFQEHGAWIPLFFLCNNINNWGKLKSIGVYLLCSIPLMPSKLCVTTMAFHWLSPPQTIFVLILGLCLFPSVPNLKATLTCIAMLIWFLIIVVFCSYVICMHLVFEIYIKKEKYKCKCQVASSKWSTNNWYRYLRDLLKRYFIKRNSFGCFVLSFCFIFFPLVLLVVPLQMRYNIYQFYLTPVVL